MDSNDLSETNSVHSTRAISKQQKLKALFASIVGGVFFAVSILFFKLSGTSSNETAFLSGFCGSLYCSALICFNPESLPKSKKGINLFPFQVKIYLLLLVMIFILFSRLFSTKKYEQAEFRFHVGGYLYVPNHT